LLPAAVVTSPGSAGVLVALSNLVIEGSVVNLLVALLTRAESVVLVDEHFKNVFLAMQTVDVIGSHTPGCDNIVVFSGCLPEDQTQFGSPSSWPLLIPSPSESFWHSDTVHILFSL
jgi:hypothetical protein